MSQLQTSSYSIRPKKTWWLVGIITLMLCLLVQMPASWLLNQFMPNNPYVQQVTGNIWQGRAVVIVPAMVAGETPITGALVWQWQPLALLTGKLGADIELTSGQTRLNGDVRWGVGSWQVEGLSGSIDKKTLSSLVDWQLPDAPIKVNNVSLTHQADIGFNDVDGQLTWVGGEFGYPSGGSVFPIMLPSMRADIGQTNRNGADVIQVNLVTDDNKRLGDFYLDNEGMLDVSLTQRLLENMPSYTGSAPADTAVISVRQPLLSGLSGVGANQNGVSSQ